MSEIYRRKIYLFLEIYYKASLSNSQLKCIKNSLVSDILIYLLIITPK